MQTARPTASRSCVDRGGLGLGGGHCCRAPDAAAPRRRRPGIGRGRPAALAAAARGVGGVRS
jgi:hypothetical protein